MLKTQPKIRHVTKEQIQPFVAAFNYFYKLNETTIDFLTKNTYPISLKKGEILHQSGTICNQLYFIVSGAIRGYVVEDSKEKITWISVENELVTSIYSYYMQKPSIEIMDAVEDCTLLQLSHDKLQELYEKEVTVNIIVRRVLEKYYSDAEMRALIVRFSNAEKKYDFFLNTYSHLANRISLTYIASFLGITLETLSRVRGKKRLKKVEIYC